MPASVLRIVIVLVCVAAMLGYWLGQRQAALSETDVINAVADRYVSETGGQRHDCVARPDARDGIWVVINCGTASSINQYLVDHQGRLVSPGGMPET